MDNSFELLGKVPNVSNVHFMDISDMLVKISRAVFEDFHRNVSEGASDFRDILQGFLETCDFAVKTIEKLSEGRSEMDRNTRMILNQMSLEKDAYEMLLKLMDSEELAANNQNEESFLSKLFMQNQEFRKLATLLHWSEEIAFRNPDGFSRYISEASHFDNVDNI